MNPIDQMMQAHGATSSQAAAALFGSQPTTEGQASGFAALFGGLMQGFQVDNAEAGATPDSIQALEQLSPSQAEFLAALGVNIPDEQKPASFLVDTDVLPANGADVTAAEAGFTRVMPASLVQVNIASTANGTATAETAQLPLADIASMPEGVKTDLLSTLQGMTSSGTLPALTLTAPNGDAHILPVAELAALINTPEAVQGMVGTPQANAAQATAAGVVNPAAAATATPANAQTALDAVTSQTLSAGLVSPAPQTGQVQQAGVQAPDNADVAVSGAATNEAADMASAATAAQIANAGKQAGATSNDAQQKAADHAQNMPDGYVVAANQPQQNTAAQNNTSQATKKPATATAADKTMAAMSEDGKAASARGEALTARPVDPVAARPEAMPQMNAARDPLLTMTPERLTGLPDGSAADIVSTGLSGMRGDGGFMASMSLLGGNASRGLQGHVAKQLNMSVSKAMKAGEQEFTMRLDPAELGRVQVKLRFMDGGRVHAQVIAERPETLELLQRDARGLERAIDASGAKSQGATIEFSLDQGSGEESAGKAFAEAVQQEKMRDELAARSAGGHATGHDGDDAGTEDVPLDDILPYVDAETGLDIRV